MGTVTLGTGPRWDTIKKLAAKINSSIDEARKTDGEERESHIRDAYDSIRSWCELFVEQEMLAKVTERYQPNVRMTSLSRDFPYCESSGSKSSPNEIVASNSGLQGQSISSLSDKGCDSCREPCFLSVFVVFRLPANGVKAHGRQGDSLERSPSWQDRGCILPQLGAGDNRPIRSNTP